MDKQIYYHVKHVDGIMELFSVVETSFSGPAWNFVKSSPFSRELHEFAKSQGWSQWKGESYKKSRYQINQEDLWRTPRKNANTAKNSSQPKQ